jgi:hypothetical protein
MDINLIDPSYCMGNVFVSMRKYGKNSKMIMIIGAVLVGVSIIGIISSGLQVVKDETSGNVAGQNSLPKTGIGPISVYHVEYTFVLLLILGFGMLVWGYLGRREKNKIQA